MYPQFDLQADLFSYCLKHKGKWWATRFYRNKEVDELYARLARTNPRTVLDILRDGGPDWEKHVDSHQKSIDLALQQPKLKGE